MRAMITGVVAAGMLFGVSTSFAQKPPTTAPADALSRVKLYDAAVLSGDAQVLWDNASPLLQKAMGSPAKLADLLRGAVKKGARPDESATEVTLVRTVRAPDGSGTVITYSVTGDGTLTGLLLKPADAAPKEAASPYLNYKTKATLNAPFEGAWTVVHGGRSVRTNYHAAVPDQRFAYDILITKDGQTHTGQGTTNDDYHCFAKPLLAPAAGTVASTVNDVPDNDPGKMNPAQAMGNHVVLDLGNREYLFLCHFKQGSITVKKGDKVTPGQTLGLCGNSGNSSEPHLHIHLQDTPTPFRGKGLPLAFSNVTVDGQPADRAEPVRGQALKSR